MIYRLHQPHRDFLNLILKSYDDDKIILSPISIHLIKLILTSGVYDEGQKIELNRLRELSLFLTKL